MLVNFYKEGVAEHDVMRLDCDKVVENHSKGKLISDGSEFELNEVHSDTDIK